MTKTGKPEAKHCLHKKEKKLNDQYYGICYVSMWYHPIRFAQLSDKLTWLNHSNKFTLPPQIYGIKY